MLQPAPNSDPDSPTNLDADGIRRILLVRPSALGDVARTVPALVSLRRAYPKAVIDWLVNRPFADAIRRHPDLNNIIPFHRDRWTATLRLLRRLRANEYDLVVDLQGLARSGLFAVASRAPHRLGYANAREGAAWTYNHKHRIDRNTHAVDRMLGLLQAHGLTPVHDLTLHTDGQPPLVEPPYTALAPTAQWLCKCWPIERYIEIAQRIPGQIVILSAPHERKQVQPLIDALGDRAACPATNVMQLMTLVQHSKLVVCNDSAAAHLAVGFNRPLACVFGPTDPMLVGPYRRPETVAQPQTITPDEMRRYRKQKDDQSIIARVTVEQVWQIVEQQTASSV